MCGGQSGENSAVYGSCRASTCQRLTVMAAPTIEQPAFPGLPFTLIVTKQVLIPPRIATCLKSLEKCNARVSNC
jgi:hypothetical protein